MRRTPITLDTGQNTGLALPAVEESTAYRQPATQDPWKTPGLCPRTSLGRTRFACCPLLLKAISGAQRAVRSPHNEPVVAKVIWRRAGLVSPAVAPRRLYF